MLLLLKYVWVYIYTEKGLERDAPRKVTVYLWVVRLLVIFPFLFNSCMYLLESYLMSMACFYKQRKQKRIL